jgi:hypothetical protein
MLATHGGIFGSVVPSNSVTIGPLRNGNPLTFPSWRQNSDAVRRSGRHPPATPSGSCLVQ